MYPVLDFYIDGEWTKGRTTEAENVLNPANEETLGETPSASETELAAALDAAERAFPKWRAVNAWDRSKILWRAADIMEERLDRLARIMTLEQGKPLGEARAETMQSIETLRWSAEEAKRIYGRIVPSRDPAFEVMVRPEPVGVVLALTPWNFPSMIPMRKLGPALAAGCTVIFKPSEEVPASGLEIVRAFHDAGLPKGCLNLVTGSASKISEFYLGSGRIAKMSFTGSTRVGVLLQKQCADHMVKATMELGGHSAAIVCEDADLDLAVQQLVAFKFRNAGQVCTTVNRFFIQDSVHDVFIERYLEAMAKISVGDGLADGTTMGPLANKRRQEAVGAFVEDAARKGAKLKAGGDIPFNRGFFYNPTLLDDVPDDADLMKEEVFGPVASMNRFGTLDEAIGLANASPYGLGAYAFSQSSKNQARLAEELVSGMVGINHMRISLPEAPFGGVKMSGYGQEGGTEGMDPYVVKKLVVRSP